MNRLLGEILAIGAALGNDHDTEYVPPPVQNRQQRRGAARAQRKAAAKTKGKPLTKRERFERLVASELQRARPPIAFYSFNVPTDHPTRASVTLFVEPRGFCAVLVDAPNLDSPHAFAREVRDAVRALP